MDLPTLTDYVSIICTLFDRFEEEQAEVRGPKRGHPSTYPEKMSIVFLLQICLRIQLDLADVSRSRLLPFTSFPHLSSLGKSHSSPSRRVGLTTPNTVGLLPCSKGSPFLMLLSPLSDGRMTGLSQLPRTERLQPSK